MVHVSPTYFSPDSVIGGGERYAEELSKAMSERAKVRFVSFGQRELRERLTDSYERVILKSWTQGKMTPFSPLLWNELRDADVIHCHQYYVLPTFMAALYGKLCGKRVFVSDLGGGGWTPAYHINQSRWIHGHLPISQYAATLLKRDSLNVNVIYGGVDLRRYPERRPLVHDNSVLFLGRMLPHKGIHYLIEGMPADVLLRIIGPIGDQKYYESLKNLTEGKQVEFLHGLSDFEIGKYLRTAMALVHPTPTDKEGNAGANELFGLAVVEAMASNCPPILTQAASLPELIQHEVSGLIVPPNAPAAINAALIRFKTDAHLWRSLAIGARERVEADFTWSKVVDRCFTSYEGSARA